MGKRAEARQAGMVVVIVALVIGLIVGGAVGWFTKPVETVEVPGPTVTSTVTSTVTVTPTPSPTTPTPTPTPTPTLTPTPTPTPTPTDPYVQAAHECADWVGDETVLSREELIEELEFFATASEPYRGQFLHVIYEAVPAALWEDENAREWFEKITGIETTPWEAMSNWETIVKSQEDAKLKAGLYDVIGSDQDMIGFYTYHESGLDIGAFWEKNPELVPPHIDVEDFYARATYSSYKTGNLMALLSYNWPHATLYRHDWFTDPTYKAEFEEQYGYELKTPMEYYLTAKETGNVEDDWTVAKAVDVMEFFYRPDEDMYGSIAPLKPGDWLGYFLCDGMDDVFQLPSPAPEGKMPIEVTTLSPITSSWGLSIDETNTWGGCSVENGGVMDAPAGIAMFEHYMEVWPNYGPDFQWELDHAEQFSEIKLTGRYAIQYPHYAAWALEFGKPDSAIRNEAGIMRHEYGPQPIYAPEFNPRKPRGYIDPSGWVISNFIDDDHKAMAVLFCEFMTSKAFDLKKNLAAATPIRWSTIRDPRMMAMDYNSGGVFTLMDVHLEEQCGTDTRQVLYPEILSIVAENVADSFQRGLSGEEAAQKTAKAVDDWLIENGWMGKKI